MEQELTLRELSLLLTRRLLFSVSYTQNPVFLIHRILESVKCQLLS